MAETQRVVKDALESPPRHSRLDRESLKTVCREIAILRTQPRQMPLSKPMSAAFRATRGRFRARPFQPSQALCHSGRASPLSFRPSPLSFRPSASEWRNLSNQPPHPHTHQSPNNSSERIHHQIPHLEIPHLQNQLEELDAKRQAEGGQGREPKPAPDAESLKRGPKLRQEKPERDKDNQVGNRLVSSKGTPVKQPVQRESQMASGVVPQESKMPNDYRHVQKNQARENRQPQSNRAVRRALLPDQKDDRQGQ